MLISILVATLFFGGSSDMYIFSTGEGLVKQISEVIEEEEQQEEILSLINQLHDNLKDYNSNMSQAIKNGQILNSKYKSETEEQDFQDWIDYLYNKRQRFLEEIKDTHFNLVDKMTKEQWDSIIMEKDKD
jgi:hypothetical protein